MPLTSTTTRVGPYTRKVTKLRLRPPTKAENRRETLVATANALGGARTLAAVGVGAGGVAAIKEKASRTRDRALQQVNARKAGDEGNIVVKSLTIDDILANRVAKADELDLVALDKAFFGELKGLGNRYFQAARGQMMHGGGLSGVREATQKVSSRAAESVKNPYLQAGAGLIGAGAAAYGAKKATGWLTGKAGEKLAAQAAPIKRKALKYAGYGAAGLGGTVAAGTALGNMATNR